MTVLGSFVCGRWTLPADEGRPVADATTGREVARISSAGIDLGAARTFGAEVGGPALRELTFHERASILKALASRLRVHSGELRVLSVPTGATARDAAFDVDGGLAVLRRYANQAKRDLPHGTTVVTGGDAATSRAGAPRRTLLTSPPGVAVQFSAADLPVRGPLAMFAAAFIAGVPSVLRPAGRTAYVTERLVRCVTETGLLPVGALQLVCGDARDLLDGLSHPDAVSFTGSPEAAARLRGHPVVRTGAVRFSSNPGGPDCAVLGPDGGPGTAAFERFVERLAGDLTLRAGQRRAAARRAVVPRDLAGDVATVVSARLANVVIGNPADPETDMGPLAGLDRRERIRRVLREASGRHVVEFGDPDHVDVVGADPERGAFVSPILLRDLGGPFDDVVTRAFGPVGVLLPYRTTGEAVRVAGLGSGAGCAVFTEDGTFARDVVAGVAPLRRSVRLVATGWPGEPPGDEDADGVAAVRGYLRTATVEGEPDRLGAVTGTWVPGAARNDSGPHPLRTYLTDLRVGDSLTVGPRTVSREDILHFADFTGDTFYAHTDEDAAKRNPVFGGLVAHGYLVVSLATGLFVTPEPGPVLANYGLENLRFLAPVRPGDAISVTLTARQISPRAGGDGEVRWFVDVRNQDGASVVTYDLLTLTAGGPR